MSYPATAIESLAAMLLPLLHRLWSAVDRCACEIADVRRLCKSTVLLCDLRNAAQRTRRESTSSDRRASVTFVCRAALLQVKRIAFNATARAGASNDLGCALGRRWRANQSQQVRRNFAQATYHQDQSYFSPIKLWHSIDVIASILQQRDASTAFALCDRNTAATFVTRAPRQSRHRHNKRKRSTNITIQHQRIRLVLLHQLPYHDSRILPLTHASLRLASLLRLHH